MEGEDIFACVGLWRTSDEWGDVYPMVMTDVGGAAAEVHVRMPVLLAGGRLGEVDGLEGGKAQGFGVGFEGEVRVERTGQE